MNNEIDFLLLDRYRAGECTPAERAAVERWVAADPARGELVTWMQELETAAAAQADPWNEDNLWSGVRDRLGEKDKAPEHAHLQPQEQSPARPRPETPRRWGGISATRAVSPIDRVLRVAAAIGLIVAGTVIWRSGGGARPAQETGAYRTITAGGGERAVVSLNDGSQVMVDAGSTLRVPHDFGGTTREVRLDGRAYFEVAPDSMKPFRVYSGHTVTRVLGTKFGVRAYAEDSTVSVIVREGRVALAAVPDSVTRPGSIVLNAGDLGVLGADGQLRTQREVSVDVHLAWTSGRLTFVNTPLRSVLPELGRRYGLDIVTADHRIDTLLWTASLQHETAPEALHQLVASLELQADRRGNRVVLRFPPSKGLAR